MKEFFKRLSLPSPKFFNKWANFFLFVIVTTGGLTLGENFGLDMLQEWAYNTLKTVLSCAVVGLLFCKLAVYDWSKKSGELEDR